MKLNKKKGIILASSVISLILIGVFFVIYETGPYDKNNGQDIVVDIPMGSTISNIADILKENNLIKNKFIFEINFKLRNNYSNLKSGKYLLNGGANVAVVNKILGNSNLSSLQLYLKHIDKNLRKEIKEKHPREHEIN